MYTEYILCVRCHAVNFTNIASYSLYSLLFLFFIAVETEAQKLNMLLRIPQYGRDVTWSYIFWVRSTYGS